MAGQISGSLDHGHPAGIAGQFAFEVWKEFLG
jgi:hypothetical protein